MSNPMTDHPGQLIHSLLSTLDAIEHLSLDELADDVGLLEEAESRLSKTAQVAYDHWLARRMEMLTKAVRSAS